MKKYVFFIFLSIMAFPIVAFGGTGVQMQQQVLKGEKTFLPITPPTTWMEQ